MNDTDQGIELGDKVKDRVTGLTGIAVSRADHLYSCRQFNVRPQEAKDGKHTEGWWYDAGQLEVVEKGVLKPGRVADPMLDRPL